jgi:hemerythrin-like domain-containing protein
MTTATTPSAGPLAYFTSDHRACDELWAEVEAAVERGDASAARAAFTRFDAATRRHLDMEEQVLFPELEAATGMTMGPTRVMRAEHAQMRGLLDQMARAADRDVDALVEHGDTLLMLTQQHNMKEEGIVYPMAQAHLGDDWAPIAARLAAYLAS